MDVWVDETHYHKIKEKHTVMVGRLGNTIEWRVGNTIEWRETQCGIKELDDWVDLDYIGPLEACIEAGYEPCDLCFPSEP